MNRHRQAEQLSARVREKLPRVAAQWLAAARRPLEALTRSALDPDLTDDAFRALVEEFSRRLPTLLDELDHDALAKLMEDSMGAAMANGIAARLTPARQAKSPWSRATYEAGRRYKRDKDGKFSTTDGSGRSAESRKKLRRKPSRREKADGDAPPATPDPAREAAIARYEKGVLVHSPTGREVEFGRRIAVHLSRKEGPRSRFADLAENTVSNPDEVWEEGLRAFHLKHQASPGSRKAMLVITRQTGASKHVVVSFTKKHPRELKTIRRGRRTFPAGESQSGAGQSPP